MEMLKDKNLMARKEQLQNSMDIFHAEIVRMTPIFEAHPENVQNRESLANAIQGYLHIFLGEYQHCPINLDYMAKVQYFGVLTKQIAYQRKVQAKSERLALKQAIKEQKKLAKLTRKSKSKLGRRK